MRGLVRRAAVGSFGLAVVGCGLVLNYGDYDDRARDGGGAISGTGGGKGGIDAGKGGNGASGGTAATGGTGASGGTGGAPSCTQDFQCDDLDPCTTDTCANSNCTHTQKCTSSGKKCCAGTCADCCLDTDCNDQVACTVDQCSGGTCTSVPNDTLCGAGQTCDKTSGCKDAPQCTDVSQCNDTDPCTTDACSGTPLKCSHVNACTSGQKCCSTGCAQCCGDGDCTSFADPANCKVGKCVSGTCQTVSSCGGTTPTCCSGVCKPCCGPCAPGEQQTCQCTGTQTCGTNCQWGGCSGGADTDNDKANCGSCGYCCVTNSVTGSCPPSGNAYICKCAQCYYIPSGNCATGCTVSKCNADPCKAAACADSSCGGCA